MDLMETIDDSPELDGYYYDIDKILPELEDVQDKYNNCFDNIKSAVEIIQKIRIS